MLSDPDEVIDAALMERVWRVAVEETGDANFGLHLGEGTQPADIGVVGLAMMSCDTLHAALRRLIRYWDLMSNATRIELTTSGDVATVELQVVDTPGNFIRGNRHPVESSFSACLSLLQMMGGKPIPPRDVAIDYPAPADSREHTRILGRKPRFGAGVNALSFPEEVLRWPLRYANAVAGANVGRTDGARAAAEPGGTAGPGEAGGGSPAAGGVARTRNHRRGAGFERAGAAARAPVRRHDVP